MNKTVNTDITTVRRNIYNGRFVNLAIRELGNSTVVIFPGQILSDLGLSTGSRVMVIPYD